MAEAGGRDPDQFHGVRPVSPSWKILRVRLQTSTPSNDEPRSRNMARAFSTASLQESPGNSLNPTIFASLTN